MSGKKSNRNWTAVLAILILIGLAAVVWAIVSSLSADQTAFFELNLPVTVAGANVLALTGLQSIGVLTGLVFVLVVGLGLLITALNAYLSRQVTAVTESESYQTQLAAIVQKEKAQISAVRTERGSKPIPEHNMPRWSAISTSIIILLFVVFAGMFINGVLVPSGAYSIGGVMVNSAVPVVGGFVAIAAVVLLWRMRPERLENIQQTDDGPIPWDFIWILVSGLLIVGLGLALMVYLNAG